MASRFCIAGIATFIIFGTVGVTTAADKKAKTARDGAASTWVAEKKWTLKHDGTAYALRFSPNGRQLMTAAFDLTFRLWDVSGGRELKRFQGKKAVDVINDIAWSPDGRHVLLAAGQYKGTQQLTLWDVEKWKKVRRFWDHEYPVRRVVFSPDGRRVLSGAAYPEVTFRDIETGYTKSFHPAVGRTSLANYYEPDGHAMSVDISPNGKRGLWAGGNFHYQLWLFDLATGRPIRAFIPPPDEPSRQHVVHAVFTKDGKRILAVHSHGFLRVWDVATGKSSHPLRISPEVVRSVAYAESQGLLLVGGFSGRLSLWKMTGIETKRPGVKLLLQLQEPHPREKWSNDMGQTAAGITRVALSSGAKYAAAADHDHTVRIWSLSLND